MVQPVLQPLRNAIERAVRTPAIEAVIDALALAVAVRHLAPLGAAVEDSEDPVERDAVVVPLTAALAVGRHEVSDQLELLIRAFEASPTSASCLNENQQDNRSSRFVRHALVPLYHQPFLLLPANGAEFLEKI